MVRISVSKPRPISASVGKAKVVISGDPGSMYTGPYIVEPEFEAQTLPTKDKTLYNDVTVNAIRVERISNDHGTTVYIGLKGD